MSQTKEARNKALALEAFDTLFNKRDAQGFGGRRATPWQFFVEARPLSAIMIGRRVEIVARNMAA